MKLLLIWILLTIAAALSVSQASAWGQEGEAQTVRFLTLNVDFNDSVQKIQADVQQVAPYGDIIMFQEAKTVTIDNFLDAQWTVWQVVDQGDAKRGSALAIRNGIITKVLATGLRFGVDSNGEAMLDRYIAWADIKLLNGTTIRAMSLHMPPARYSYLQPRMADSLTTFVRETNYPIVVGADWNFTVNDDPWNIKQSTGMIPHGVGIDGFYILPADVTYKSISKLTALDVNSDHDPVEMVTSIKGTAISRIVDWSIY